MSLFKPPVTTRPNPPKQGMKDLFRDISERLHIDIPGIKENIKEKINEYRETLALEQGETVTSPHANQAGDNSAEQQGSEEQAIATENENINENINNGGAENTGEEPGAPAKEPSEDKADKGPEFDLKEYLEFSKYAKRGYFNEESRAYIAENGIDKAIEMAKQPSNFNDSKLFENPEWEKGLRNIYENMGPEKFNAYNSIYERTNISVDASTKVDKISQSDLSKYNKSIAESSGYDKMKYAEFSQYAQYGFFEKEALDYVQENGVEASIARAEQTAAKYNSAFAQKEGWQDYMREIYSNPQELNKNLEIYTKTRACIDPKINLHDKNIDVTNELNEMQKDAARIGGFYPNETFGAKTKDSNTLDKTKARAARAFEALGMGSGEGSSYGVDDMELGNN